jgi:uncharacterized protein (DUF58 family)
MSVFVILGVLAAVAVMEILSLGSRARNLSFRCTADTDLTEPGGIVTMTAYVTNSSAFPMLFVCLWLFFEEDMELREENAWAARYRDRISQNLCVQQKLSLMPHTTAAFKVRLSYSKRGVHTLGRYTLESGDFLGIQNQMFTGKMDPEIVVTAGRAEGIAESLPVSGFLGEYSVRRFIHDDPTLIIGTREYSGREPMRVISWTQTAKRGKLMVRQNDYTAEPSAVILIAMGGSRKDQEAVLALTRTVCEQLHEGNIPFALFSNGDIFRTDMGLGQSHLNLILERIGRASPTEYIPFRELTERCLQDRGSANDWILIVPARNEEAELCQQRIEEEFGSCAMVLYGEEWELSVQEGEEGKVWKMRPAY